LGEYAAALALRADLRRRAGLRAGAAALAARRLDLDRHLHLDALERVLEGEAHRGLDVGAALPGRLPRPARAATAAAPAEEPAAEVAEVAEVEVGEARAAGPAGDAAVRRAPGVVLLALLGVGEDVVGALDLLEVLLRSLVAGVLVRVVLAREL